MSLNSHDAPRHTDEECARLLDRFLLPPEQLLAVLAPEGWSSSPLLRCHHPTPDQRRREATAFRENLGRLSRLTVRRLGGEPGEADDATAAPDDEVNEEDPRPIEPEREVVDLVGRVLWDVFSDNHAVFDAHGDFDLGSFRGSAGFLAEQINMRYRQLGSRHDYMDFYMGTIWIDGRANLRPLYRWVFAELRAAGCDWRYSFPRIYLVSFGRHPEAGHELSYDPSAAVAAELEAAESEQERVEMQEDLDASYNAAVERAKRRPPRAIVQAYHEVYGRWPRGWPPSRTDE